MLWMGSERAEAATQRLETPMAVCPAERRVVMVPRAVDVMVVDEKRRMAEMLLDGAQLVKIKKLVDDDEIIGVRTAQRVV